MCAEQIGRVQALDAKLGELRELLADDFDRPKLAAAATACINNSQETFSACKFLKDLVEGKIPNIINPWNGKILKPSFFTQERLDRFNDWLGCEGPEEVVPTILTPA